MQSDLRLVVYHFMITSLVSPIFGFGALIHTHGPTPKIEKNLYEQIFGGQYKQVKHQSCSDKSGMKSAASRCSCDHRCKYAGNCCLDTFYTNEVNVTEYLKIFIRETKVSRDLECKAIIKDVGVVGNSSVPGLMVKTKCYLKANATDLVRKCQGYSISGSTKPIESWLVHAKDGYFYKNYHCANCNQQHNVTFLSIKANCRYKDHVTSKSDPSKLSPDDLRTCDYGVADTDINNRYKCLPSLYRMSDIAFKDLKNCSKNDFILCRSYLAPVTFQETYQYANPHCVKCLYGDVVYMKYTENEHMGITQIYKLTISMSEYGVQVLLGKGECLPGLRWSDKEKACVETDLALQTTALTRTVTHKRIMNSTKMSKGLEIILNLLERWTLGHTFYFYVLHEKRSRESVNPIDLFVNKGIDLSKMYENATTSLYRVVSPASIHIITRVAWKLLNNNSHLKVIISPLASLNYTLHSFSIEKMFYKSRVCANATVLNPGSYEYGSNNYSNDSGVFFNTKVKRECIFWFEISVKSLNYYELYCVFLR